MRKKLVLATATADLPVNMAEFTAALGSDFHADVVPLPFGEMNMQQRDKLWARVQEASGLFVRTGVVPRELISLCGELKVIALHGVGVDQVDVKAATERGVYVTNVPGGNAVSVVELTFGLMLGLLRRIPRADALMRMGRWEEARTVGRELSGKTLGLVGFGTIAQRVALVARAFGMEVVYWSRTPMETELAVYVAREDLFASADVVSIHIPLTDQTRGMVDRTLLALLKPQAILINTARGAVIQEDHLVDALRRGSFAGAGLDVFASEPLSSDSPLLSLPNVLLTPHMAGSTEECLVRLARTAGEDIRRVLCSERPLHAVNKLP
ncbi:MAG TPA: hydroxyacid dehydrogenase [Bacillota bacterium]|nr:hydroxyacid dehydrogenase [Bacillota bacterium]